MSLPLLFVPLLLVTADPTRRDAKSPSEGLARVREVHGAAGPWAVVGYRMGQRAQEELKLPRHSSSLLVVHRCPAEFQYSCIADGLQAATGASPGKMNLRVETVPVGKMCTVIEDHKTGRRLTFTLRPEFTKTILDLPQERLEAEGERVARLSEEAMFRMEETKTKAR